MFFLGETPWNRPTGITTFFAINQEGVDQSFSSSNSTEISMRRFYAQNFITIGLALEALSCKRTDTLTDSIVSSLFEYTKKGQADNVKMVTYKSVPNYISSLFATFFFKLRIYFSIFENWKP